VHLFLLTTRQLSETANSTAAFGFDSAFARRLNLPYQRNASSTPPPPPLCSSAQLCALSACESTATRSFRTSNLLMPTSFTSCASLHLPPLLLPLLPLLLLAEKAEDVASLLLRPSTEPPLRFSSSGPYLPSPSARRNELTSPSLALNTCAVEALLLLLLLLLLPVNDDDDDEEETDDDDDDDDSEFFSVDRDVPGSSSWATPIVVVAPALFKEIGVMNK
jgi:hypothetical protein